jgi:hypothetical protein
MDPNAYKSVTASIAIHRNFEIKIKYCWIYSKANGIKRIEFRA